MPIRGLRIGEAYPDAQVRFHSIPEPCRHTRAGRRSAKQQLYQHAKASAFRRMRGSQNALAVELLENLIDAAFQILRFRGGWQDWVIPSLCAELNLPELHARVLLRVQQHFLKHGGQHVLAARAGH